MIIAEMFAALTNSYYTRFLVGLVLPMILGGMMGSATAQELLPQSDVSNSRSIVIDMESYVFSPSEIMVDAGKPITLVLNNQSFLVPHNFLLDDPNGVRVLEAEISSGESQTHTLTLTEPGIYPFYCDKQLLFFPTHREEGMEGRLIVQ
jgi:plastocyanin